MLNTLDRYQGALLGLAAGDALGTTLEFTPRASVRPIDDMVGGGPYNLASGQWTDDTSMAMCLAASLVERGFDPRDQMDRYVRWWKEGYWSSNGRCFDIGTTVRSALQRYLDRGEPFAGSSDPQTAGNGSLMRFAPVVLRYASDADRAVALAAESSKTTHAAAEAVDACRYFARLLLRALAGQSKGDILAPVEDEFAPSIATIASGSFKSKSADAIRASGYVVHTLEAALWAFHHSNDFREGALLAVNLGDDADTTGAVFGQIAGAHYGVDGIPPDWRGRLARRREIEALAAALFVENAADRKKRFSGGPTSRQPMPVPIPDSYWLLEGRLLAGEYPGASDVERARVKLAALLDAGIRSFIDLTERVDPLEPYEHLLREVAGDRGIDVRYTRMSIRDMSIPTREVMTAILARIEAELAEGRPVYFHCWGGIGRTGTVAACWLRGQGHSCDDAMARLRRLRAFTPDGWKESPQTREQQDFVRLWDPADER